MARNIIWIIIAGNIIRFINIGNMLSTSSRL